MCSVILLGHQIAAGFDVPVVLGSVILSSDDVEAQTKYPCQNSTMI